MGDSGNAETTAPHLHFEIIDPAGNPTNPYDSLRQAAIIPTPFTYPEAENELLPFTSSYGGKVNIAKGQYDSNDESELVVAAGAGGGPHVKVYKKKVLMSEFFAYDPAFRGGVDVASGDVDGDGIDEIITAAGPGGGPHVRILRLNGSEISSFYAYAPAFGGGVSVAAGDVDGDGKDEIITGPGAGGGPHMKVFKPNGLEVTSFFAYDPAMRSGLDVASGDVYGDSKDEIITAAGPGGGPHVMVFDINRVAVGGFYAYDPKFTGGVRVSAANVVTNTSKDEIVTVPAGPGGSHARIVDKNGANFNNKIFLEAWWDGYYDIAAGEDGEVFAATGENRRGSVREVF